MRRELLRTLWNHSANGYEDAIFALQTAYLQRPNDEQARIDLKVFLDAVRRMFTEMDRPVGSSLEFAHEPRNSVVQFLERFDSIFTLNQDLLLEGSYLPVSRHNVVIPGITQDKNAQKIRHWLTGPCAYYPDTPLRVPPSTQLYIKLHGSHNWNDPRVGGMMITGAAKSKAIDRFPLLSWYRELFRKQLAHTNCRLMIIGYSFRDEHINAVVTEAVLAGGLEVFVVDPRGHEVIKGVSEQDKLRTAFERGLLGASRRSMRDIFLSDSTEFKKLDYFAWNKRPRFWS